MFSTSFVFSTIALGVCAAGLGLLALVDTHKQKQSAAIVASVAIMSIFALCAWLVGDEMNWDSIQSLGFIAVPGIAITAAVGRHARLVHTSLCLAASGLIMALLTFNLLGTPWSIFAGAATFLILLAATNAADRADTVQA